jgi:hypothetical protein
VHAKQRPGSSAGSGDPRSQLDGEFAVSYEVDKLRWFDMDAAAHVLTYERDRELLAALDTIGLARSG